MCPYLRILPSIALASLFTPLQGATHDLLQPAWQVTWQTSTEKETPVKIVFAKDTGWMTVSRPGASFNPVILATHFGKEGPLPVGATSPPEVTLANIGDTVGIRMVVSYNKECCAEMMSNTARLALTNSRGTRQSQPFTDINHAVFEDDTGWSLHFNAGEISTALYHRQPSGGNFKLRIITSSVGGKRVASWPDPAFKGYFKPDEPVEAVFSLTRTGPQELKTYGFIAAKEFEHTATDVKDFSFDTLYFHYPVGGGAHGAAFTIREFQLITPGK